MKIYKITEASEYLEVSTMPNLDEIKARWEKITPGREERSVGDARP